MENTTLTKIAPLNGRNISAEDALDFAQDGIAQLVAVYGILEVVAADCQVVDGRLHAKIEGKELMWHGPSFSWLVA